MGHFAALHFADALVVEEVYDFHHLIAVVILLKGFQHQRSSQRVKVIKLFLVDFVAYGSRTASTLPFQSIFGLASNDLFGKFCGIVSLPVGTVRKENGSLPRGRRSRLISLAKKNRKFPLGNSLSYLSCADFSGCVLRGAPCFCFVFDLLIHGSDRIRSNTL